MNSRSVEPQKGEIWIINFSPSIGDEIQKLRPAVIVSNDNIGKLALKIVAPITTWKTKYGIVLWMINIHPSKMNNLTDNSAVDSFQVKSVSIERFHKKIGKLTSSELNAVINGIMLCIT